MVDVKVGDKVSKYFIYSNKKNLGSKKFENGYVVIQKDYIYIIGNNFVVISIEPNNYNNNDSEEEDEEDEDEDE